MRIFDFGEPADGPRQASSRIATVPNAISLARILALPFIWADLVAGRHLRALVLVGIFSATDWVDGYLARRLDQVTQLGQLLDPLADRALFAVVAIGSAVGGLLPWWVVVAVVGRDVLVVAVAGLVLAASIPPPAVTRSGKAATFGLMVSFPLLLGAAILGDGVSAPQPTLHAATWIVLSVSLMLYWVTALSYGRTLFSTLRSRSAR
ncbi:MAG: CDP-alcohol phosphatidyltransferase family protein [Nitriliruptoraceae bacterium]